MQIRIPENKGDQVKAALESIRVKLEDRTGLDVSTGGAAAYALVQYEKIMAGPVDPPEAGDPERT